MKPLSKSKLIAFRQCPKRLWLEVNGPAQPETDALTQARYDDGHAVGKLAQSLYNRKGKGTVFDPSKQGYDEVVRLTQDRINSTQPLFEAGFHAAGARTYHPDQQGSWSIKYVLPTIAPDLNYDTLDGVKDGTKAMLAYREAIDPATPAQRKTQIERELLDYCCRDTIAMLRLWQHLTGRASLKG